ncbi:MAG: hypothetical protein GTO45_18200 [Candidatus Aminicenantes bacterium]|nr:hypothetical protein [Candidatus Aminicenantes bacterium]NIM80720.1 hypothetical protein [Candidatus Aminicenantes bacterium]NIN20095.1 hypothetical protein [Candidatus Aminicenantes bacterium]NIN43882.1 hypothetical protein [Candidatus Aminicenantes bacterium]NIN86691.1 hypothetical protein [Candidatus Aminicenantes bacterium]
MLGDRFNGISELLMVGFALGDSEGVFYWHPDDVMRLLNLIRWGYLFFDKKEKQAALKLLAKLGKNGKATAGRVFDFKRETHQDLRNVFLEHFYSIDFWEKHVDHFNLYDYLCLIRNKKPAPFLENTLLQGKVERFLRNVSRSLPGSITRITDTNKLPEIYEKVSVLAFLGSPHFQNKASDIFKMSFDPEKVLHLLLICRNFSDRVWLLEQYFKYMQDTAVPLAHWWKLIVDFFEKLSVKERSKIIKIFIDTRLPLIPEGFKSHLFRILEDSDPTIIGLSDWENWIKKHHISPFYTLLSIIKMKHPQIFQLIENNYDYFKEEFSFYLFEILYKINRRKTLQLVKKLYPLSSPKIRLYCAVFLVNKNYREYSPYILEFLREAGNNKHKQDILKRFYGVEALIPIVEANKNFKEELRYLLYDRELFYQLVRLNVRLWPEEVKRIILESKIPYSEGEGIPLLRACEKLPDLYRKKMLIKICEADIDETFRLNADSSLVRHYPGEFLKLAYNREYYRHFFKKTLMAQAYQNLSYKVLRHDLVLNLKDPKPGVNVNRRIDFICEALTKKEARGELNIQDLQHILKEFNRPVERMLLRKLRHHVHKRYFQDGEKDE